MRKDPIKLEKALEIKSHSKYFTITYIRYQIKK